MPGDVPSCVTVSHSIPAVTQWYNKCFLPTAKLDNLYRNCILDHHLLDVLDPKALNSCHSLITFSVIGTTAHQCCQMISDWCRTLFAAIFLRLHWPLILLMQAFDLGQC